MVSKHIVPTSQWMSSVGGLLRLYPEVLLQTKCQSITWQAAQHSSKQG